MRKESVKLLLTLGFIVILIIISFLNFNSGNSLVSMGFTEEIIDPIKNFFKNIFSPNSLQLAPSCSGTTCTAASCNQGDVQAAINQAGDGYTVVIPSGTCTWSSAVSVNANQKSVHVEGSGSGVGGTRIQTNPSSYSDGATTTFVASGIDGRSWSISNMRIDSNINSAETRIITVGGTSKDWRISSIDFYNNGPSRAWYIRIGGYTYGVIDHHHNPAMYFHSPADDKLLMQSL